MKSYEVTKIGQHRGKPRLWLEGSKALLGGFLPGKRFEAKKDLDKQMLTQIGRASWWARVLISVVAG